MLAGTGSDVGKSVLAAALCRILRQDGYRPAPFKAQNMSLNSYATPEGFEIGRAQAVQAEAAGIPCHTDMNPVLLKPNSDHTSQVVLNGRPVGNSSAYDYFRRGGREELRAAVCAAFDRLAVCYNPIVMEGAGSIAEINLRDRDIVNMSMARHAGADVFLVADIDRGGVFASAYGSIMLQTPEDRRRIKGIIVNKFRGDRRLFDDGVRMMEEVCGVPVLGVIPYFHDIQIEEEDSVELEQKNDRAAAGRVNVAVVKLLHLSNFTDFDRLERDGRVHLYYTDRADELQKADVIVLPGSKSTLDDLRELKRNGLAEAVKASLLADPELFAIFEKGDVDARIGEIIYRSLRFKKNIVEQDEQEHGMRKALNFGHTIGHGIEAVKGIKGRRTVGLFHGECVALGMLPMIESKALQKRVRAVYRRLGLPLRTTYNKEKVLAEMLHDKKAQGGQITVIKVPGLGCWRAETIPVEGLRPLLGMED